MLPFSVTEFDDVYTILGKNSHEACEKYAFTFPLSIVILHTINQLNTYIVFAGEGLHVSHNVVLVMSNFM